MDPLSIIDKYYDTTSELYRVLVKHSRSVADKALFIAESHPEMNLDLAFIEEAAMLHDIGVIFCNAPDIGCYGKAEYVCHGYLGAELIRKEGFPRHAFVCERHTGTGISRKMIEQRNLPLPKRNFQPVSLEEKLICFADKFFSKKNLYKEKSISKIEKSLNKHGNDTVLRFKEWCNLFLV